MDHYDTYEIRYRQVGNPTRWAKWQRAVWGGLTEIERAAFQTYRSHPSVTLTFNLEGSSEWQVRATKAVK